jgi:Putative DNA-binding domain
MNQAQIDTELTKIFTLNSKGHIKARESSTNEFKEAFNWNSKADYAKTMIAFANNKWGFLIFGIKDSPKVPVGLLSDNFDKRDPAEISNYLQQTFLWDISFETWVHEFDSKKFWYIYTREVKTKPIVCNKNDGRENVLKEWDIYFRDGARSKRIDWTTLTHLIEQEREKERSRWMGLFEKIGKIGVQNAWLLNLQSGEVSGEWGSFLIDEELLPKIQFIKEWYFSETEWAPALKLVGELTSTAKIIEREIDSNEIYRFWTKDLWKEVWFAENNATSNATALIKHFWLNSDEYMKEFKLYESSKPTKKYSQTAVDLLKSKLNEWLFSLDTNSDIMKEIRKQVRNS